MSVKQSVVGIERERSAVMVTHLHETEQKTGSGFLVLYDRKPKL